MNGLGFPTGHYYVFCVTGDLLGEGSARNTGWTDGTEEQTSLDTSPSGTIKFNLSLYVINLI